MPPHPIRSTITVGSIVSASRSDPPLDTIRPEMSARQPASLSKCRSLTIRNPHRAVGAEMCDGLGDATYQFILDRPFCKHLARRKTCLPGTAHHVEIGIGREMTGLLLPPSSSNIRVSETRQGTVNLIAFHLLNTRRLGFAVNTRSCSVRFR